ncbi:MULTISPECIES: hypothetical protein [unclassified Streptomyces]|uniref:hypothetical protein n=1 Tax=unclassified Streptomyces TaxID=2593676 RepID=UPI003D7027EE
MDTLPHPDRPDRRAADEFVRVARKAVREEPRAARRPSGTVAPAGRPAAPTGPGAPGAADAGTEPATDPETPHHRA